MRGALPCSAGGPTGRARDRSRRGSAPARCERIQEMRRSGEAFFAVEAWRLIRLRRPVPGRPVGVETRMHPKRSDNGPTASGGTDSSGGQVYRRPPVQSRASPSRWRSATALGQEPPPAVRSRPASRPPAAAVGSRRSPIAGLASRRARTLSCLCRVASAAPPPRPAGQVRRFVCGDRSVAREIASADRSGSVGPVRPEDSSTRPTG